MALPISLAPDDFWHGVFGHVRALGEKDLSFAIELAGTLGVDVPLASEPAAAGRSSEEEMA